MKGSGVSDDYGGRTRSHQGAEALSLALDERAEALALTLLGKPSLRLPGAWRWGRHGSLSLTLNGHHRGRWRSFETGDHGDLLDLIATHAVPGEGIPGAIRWSAAWLGGAAPEAPRRAAPPPAEDAPDAAMKRRISIARWAWGRTEAVQGSVAERYLNSRGLVLPPDVADLRFLPRCKRQDGTFHPALVAAFRRIEPDQAARLRGEEGNPVVAIHRTFLQADGSGKAEGQARSMFGPVAGCAIKLTPDDAVEAGLALTEGIETALAVMATGTRPVWACGSAAALTAFPVLPGIESLTIYADHDGAGLQAAEQCAERWRSADRDCRVILPPSAGRDWADLLQGAAA